MFTTTIQIKFDLNKPKYRNSGRQPENKYNLDKNDH